MTGQALLELLEVHALEPLHLSHRTLLKIKISLFHQLCTTHTFKIMLPAKRPRAVHKELENTTVKKGGRQNAK